MDEVRRIGHGVGASRGIGNAHACARRERLRVHGPRGCACGGHVLRAGEDASCLQAADGADAEVLAPQQGLKGPSVVPVRPGEKASLVVEVQGPVAKPTLAFGTTSCTFDETLAADESLVCRDGRTWKVVVTATGKARRTGTLSAPLPTLSGSTPFAFSGEVPADKSCVVEILKEYVSQ